MSFVLGLYRLLLRLLPREMRDAHGPEMAALVAEELAAVRAKGLWTVVRIIACAASDVIRRAPYERWRRRPSGRTDVAARLSRVSTEVRLALRAFARHPGTTSLLVGTLTLAISASSSILAVVDAVYFRSLPYGNASRLVNLNETAPKWDLPFAGVNFPDFVAWRKRAHAFESMGLWSNASFNVSDGSTPERLEGQQVTYDLARTLGIRPVLGRAFTREEDVPNGPNVVMIAYSFWQSRYGGSRAVIGRTLRIRGEPWTIVGVLPPNVMLDGPTTLWVPLRGDPNQAGEAYSHEGVGLLKAGVSLDAAREDLYAAHDAVWRAADTAHVVSPRVMPLRDRFLGDLEGLATSLGAAVAALLLVACANVASVVMGRAMLRRREVGVRVALGATRARLVEQSMLESLVLVAVSGILGILIARLGISALASGLDSPPTLLLAVGLRAGLLPVAVVLATTLFFSIAGMARALPTERLSSALVVIQVALAAVLFATGGLLLRAHVNLRNSDPGFRAAGVAAFRVSLSGPRYQAWPAEKHFYDQLIERVRALPDVDAAGIVSCAPLSCRWTKSFAAEGARSTNADDADPAVLWRLASPEYFEAMGIQLVRGRFYAATEGAPDGLRPAVINEELAKQLWPDGRDPIGKRFSYRGDTSSRDWMTVIGIVHDVRDNGLSHPMTAGLYLSTAAVHDDNDFPSFAVVAHTPGDADALFPALRRIVRELDPELPVFAAEPMRAALDRWLAPHHALTVWLGAFATAAIVLALGGIYSTLSYTVARRRHEIGIRLAMGAQPTRVIRFVVLRGLWLIGVGLLIGLPASFAAAPLISSQLVGVTTRDPATYAATVAALLGTGIAAALIPAWRAARVDPKIAFAEVT